jgi:hypothetical protein
LDRGEVIRVDVVDWLHRGKERRKKKEERRKKKEERRRKKDIVRRAMDER